MKYKVIRKSNKATLFRDVKEGESFEDSLGDSHHLKVSDTQAFDMRNHRLQNFSPTVSVSKICEVEMICTEI